MKRFLLSFVALLVGLCLGWYFGYIRPVTQDYRSLRDHFHMTDQQMLAAGVQVRDNLPQFIEEMRREDKMTTAVALGTLVQLEEGNVEKAKEQLLPWIGSYYRKYHAKGAKGGDANTLATIKEIARRYPDIATEIGRKNE